MVHHSKFVLCWSRFDSSACPSWDNGPRFCVFVERLMLLQVFVLMWGGIVSPVSLVLAGLGCVSGMLKSVSSLFLQESGEKPKIRSPISSSSVYLAQRIDG